MDKFQFQISDDTFIFICFLADSVATPHGINDILSRPVAMNTPVSSALGTALAGAIPRFSLNAAAVAAGGMYFGPTNGGLHKLTAGQLYWNSMVQNQALWRERLAGSGKYLSSKVKFIYYYHDVILCICC